MAVVLRYRLGQRAAESQRLQGELSQALNCLGNPTQKARYDAELRRATPHERVANTSNTPTSMTGAEHKEKVPASALLAPVPLPLAAAANRFVPSVSESSTSSPSVLWRRIWSSQPVWQRLIALGGTGTVVLLIIAMAMHTHHGTPSVAAVDEKSKLQSDDPTPAVPVNNTSTELSAALPPTPTPVASLVVSTNAEVTLSGGSRATIPVHVDRRGLSGPVQVSLSELPPNVFSRNVVISADETDATIDLLADGNAESTSQRINVVALLGDFQGTTTIQLLLAAKATAAPQDAAPDGAKEPAPSGNAIGRLSSIPEQEVLLRTVDSQWQRIASGTRIASGEQLIALPTYGPMVFLDNGDRVTGDMQLLGGCIVSVNAARRADVPEIHLESGRLVLRTENNSGAKFGLHAGDDRGTFQFGKRDDRDTSRFGKGDAVLAVELRHLLVEGADPEQDPAGAEVDIYLVAGEVTWIDRLGSRTTLVAPSHRSLANIEEAQRSAEPPAWIASVAGWPDQERPWSDASGLNPNERRASADIDSFLRQDRPVRPALADLATHRKIANSLLAIRCLAILDDFEPVVPLLNDTKYRL
ncbi:MAG TPA: hypothetical protein VFI31_09280, partial [Pirellulales bacterium]|nr:hypothetical protein [Pirellulales bacterium]